MLKDIFKKFKLLGIASFIVAIISGLCGTYLLYAINKSVTTQTVGDENSIFSYFLILFLMFFSEIISQSIFLIFSNKSICKLQIDMCRRVLLVDLYKLEKIGINKLHNCLIQDLASISTVIFGLPSIIINSCFIFIFLTYLLIKSKIIFLVIILFIIISFSMFLYFNKKVLAPRYQKSRNISNDVFRSFDDLLRGVKELKQSCLKEHNFFNKKIDYVVHLYENENRFSMILNAILQTSWRVIFFVFIGFLSILSRYSIVFESEFAQTTILIMFLIPPISSIVSFIPVAQKAIISLRHINFFYDKTNPSQDETNLTFKNSFLNWKKLQFKNVSFSYNETAENKPIIRSISFCLFSGKIAFVNGPNGSGKTTFAKLLTGLYTPTSGHIIINDIIISKQNIRFYKELFSVVFSDFHLFDKTFIFNELDPKFKLMAQSIGRQDKLTSNIIDVREMSNGQKQFCALLLSVMEDKSIYVFDESSSNLDFEVKNFFFHTLVPMLKERGKTIFVITHDIQYNHIADFLIDIRNGGLLIDPAPPGVDDSISYLALCDR